LLQIVQKTPYYTVILADGASLITNQRNITGISRILYARLDGSVENFSVGVNSRMFSCGMLFMPVKGRNNSQKIIFSGHKEICHLGTWAPTHAF
jgi:hypothetical protein